MWTQETSCTVHTKQLTTLCDLCDLCGVSTPLATAVLQRAICVRIDDLGLEILQLIFLRGARHDNVLESVTRKNEGSQGCPIYPSRFARTSDNTSSIKTKTEKLALTFLSMFNTF